MKLPIKIIIAFITLTVQLNAQRLLPGQQGIQLTLGTANVSDTEQASYVGAALSTYGQHGNRWVIGGEYLLKQFDYVTIYIPVAQFTVEGGYYTQVFSDPSKTWIVSLGTSALAGYETSNWNHKLLFDGATLRNADAFLYGGALTLELETYITDRFIFSVHARERVLWGSSVGQFTTQLGAGIKFILH